MNVIILIVKMITRSVWIVILLTLTTGYFACLQQGITPFFFIGNAYFQIRAGMLPNFLGQMWSECCLSRICGCLFSKPWSYLFSRYGSCLFLRNHLIIYNLHTYALHMFKMEMVELYSLTLVNKWRKSGGRRKFCKFCLKLARRRRKICHFWLKFSKNRNKQKNQPKSWLSIY